MRIDRIKFPETHTYPEEYCMVYTCTNCEWKSGENAGDEGRTAIEHYIETGHAIESESTVTERTAPATDETPSE